MDNFQNGRLGRQTRTERQQLTRGKLTKYQCHTALLVNSDSAAAYNFSSEADSKMEGNRISNVMATEFMLRKRPLIWVQALSTVTRNVLTIKRFSADFGLSS